MFVHNDYFNKYILVIHLYISLCLEKIAQKVVFKNIFWIAIVWKESLQEIKLVERKFYI